MESFCAKHRFTRSCSSTPSDDFRVFHGCCFSNFVRSRRNRTKFPTIAQARLKHRRYSGTPAEILSTTTPRLWRFEVVTSESQEPVPFEYQGVILSNDENVARAAGHHSALRLPGSDEWVICYHRRPLQETEYNHRVTCLEPLHFNADGTIDPVRLSHTGVKAWMP